MNNLVLGIGLLFIFCVVAISFGYRWAVRFGKQVGAAHKAGLHADPEFVRRMRGLYIISFVTFIVQLALVVVIFISKLSVVGWIAIAVTFVVSYVVRIRTSALRRQLLVEGVK